MSYTSDVRAELARVPVERACDAAAELAGAVFAGGGLSFRGPGRYGLEMKTESRAILERHMALMKRFFGVEASVRAQHTDRLGGQMHYALSTEGEGTLVLAQALHLLDKEQLFGLRAAPDSALIHGDCCRRALLRGAFLLCGSVSNPERSYHLELAQQSGAFAEAMRALFLHFELPARLSRRKSQIVVYIKEAEALSGALALLGADRAMMALENVRIVKGLRNDVNRQVNCDNNNMDKIVAASEKQISMIRAIEKRLGADGMPPPLRDVAMLRLRHPDASLSEIGDMLNPPLGKSGVNARMRKLEALAEQLLNG